MEIFILILILVLGLVLVIKGGDLVVDVCSKLGDLTGISDVLIGSTVVSFATTLPELTITILGMSQGSVDLVLGNGFGTVLVNICLVLGLSLCFVRLKRVNKTTRSKLLYMLVLVLLLSFFAIINVLNVYVGILFLLLFLLYFIKTFLDIKKDLNKKSERQENFQNEIVGNLQPKIESKNLKNEIHVDNSNNQIAENKTDNINFDIDNIENKRRDLVNENLKVKKDNSKNVNTKEKILMVIKFIVGALLIFGGAQLIINATENLTNLLNISATFIGLTVVAVGTSLPELVTSVLSIKKKRLNLALGNVVGANIINLTLLFSLAMIISGNGGIMLNAKDLYTLLPAVILSTLILALPVLFKKRTYKFQGFMLLSLYAIYCIIIILAIWQCG